MNRRKRAVLLGGGLALLVIFFSAPFPLITYISRHPALNDQIGNGLASTTWHAVYNWWLPDLANDNPYKKLYLQHMAKVCAETTGFCRDAPPPDRDVPAPAKPWPPAPHP